MAGFKLNRELAKFLGDNPTYHEQSIAEPSTSYHAPKWHVRDRLSEEDSAELIAAFKAGSAKHVLAKRYGINEKSVKQLLREHGVKKAAPVRHTTMSWTERRGALRSALQPVSIS